jgi:nickel-dependent lactate racemase
MVGLKQNVDLKFLYKSDSNLKHNIGEKEEMDNKKSIRLPFGNSFLDFSLAEERLEAIIAPVLNYPENNSSQEDIVRESIENPIASRRLCELSVGKQDIVLIASDHTRPVPSRIITPIILNEIRKGNPRANITILISTGTHRASTREELIDKFGASIVENEQIVMHDAVNSEVVKIGILPSGGDLLINRIAIEADLLVAEGFIEPHFFAGFSGGRKSVFPGITNRKSVLANHCAEFIAHPNCRTGILEGNPIHKDMVYAAEAAQLAFIANVVLDHNKKIIAAYAGHFDQAHRKGASDVSALFGANKALADIVIAANGGYPLDQNIYQSVKGMTAAEVTCMPGGVIIMVAECSDGHGGKSFFETFASSKSVFEIHSEILSRGKDQTVMDQWESQILARILLKHEVIMVTKAPEEMIRNFRMHCAPDIDSAVKMAEGILNNPEAKITIIPDGVSVIINM